MLDILFPFHLPLPAATLKEGRFGTYYTGDLGLFSLIKSTSDTVCWFRRPLFECFR